MYNHPFFKTHFDRIEAEGEIVTSLDGSRYVEENELLLLIGQLSLEQATLETIVRRAEGDLRAMKEDVRAAKEDVKAAQEDADMVNEKANDREKSKDEQISNLQDQLQDRRRQLDILAADTDNIRSSSQATQPDIAARAIRSERRNLSRARKVS